MKKRPTKSLAERIKVIRSARGSLKGKMGDKPFAQWWAEHVAEEKELEEKREQKLEAMILNGQRRKLNRVKSASFSK
jgi:hypothetical protein